MRKTILIGCSLATLSLAVSCLGSIKVGAQIPILLSKMQAHYRGLSSLKANVKMDQFNAALGEHDVREGKLIYIPQKGSDAFFKIEWTSPSTEFISVVKKNYVIYRPKLNVAYTGLVSSVTKEKGLNGALSILNMSRAELANNFLMGIVGEEKVASGEKTTHVLLTPKTATSYKSADIWVDVDGMPIQMKQTEKNGDETTILLSKISKNTKFKYDDVTTKPPSGTKIIQG